MFTNLSFLYYNIHTVVAVTQEQYDAAKDIVLDLLGWGVPPEYLVTCGLSRQIVYYVFVELNLRLPSNLDATGLPYYSPEYAVPPSPALSTASSTSQSMPFSHSPQISNSQHTSPPKPGRGVSILNPSAAIFEPSTSATHSPSQPMSAPLTSNLLDIEQQRRQELLARKAVLASRKAKQAASNSSISSSADSATSIPKDIDMPPSKDVDEFLKTIEPAAGDVPAQGTSTSVLPPPADDSSMFDAMDVDDSIPGLSMSAMRVVPSTKPFPPAGSFSPSQSMSLSDMISPSTATEPGSALVTPSEHSFRSVSVEPSTRDRTPSNGTDIDIEIPGLRAQQSFGSMSHSSRRALRRPVAADFVDMDTGASSFTSNGFTSGYGLRRKTGTFAGLGGSRRCVIDLSDSEDESDDDDESGQQSDRTEASRARFRRPLSTTSNRVSPPSVTPVALQEKEEEIRRMRQLIEERERNRLRKLAVGMFSF